MFFDSVSYNQSHDHARGNTLNEIGHYGRLFHPAFVSRDRGQSFLVPHTKWDQRGVKKYI